MLSVARTRIGNCSALFYARALSKAGSFRLDSRGRPSALFGPGRRQGRAALSYKIEFHKLTPHNALLYGVIELTYGNMFVVGEFGRLRVSKVNPNLCAGDLVTFETYETYAYNQKRLVPNILSVVREYNYMCGVVVDDGGPQLLPHRYPDRKRIFLPDFKPTSGHTDFSVYLCKLDRKSGTARVLKYLGENLELETQKKCVLTATGFGASLDEVYSSEDYINSMDAVEDSFIDPSEGRRDFSDSITFAIDPNNAMDSDDAVSIKQVAADTYELGVHVADVTHFLKKDPNALEEAKDRGFSCFISGTCHPMLPKNFGVARCSLMPNVLRPTFSVVFTIENGRTVNTWIGRSFIKSRYLFTYSQAGRLLQSSELELSDYNRSLAPEKQVSPELHSAVKSCYALFARLRDQRGSDPGFLPSLPSRKRVISEAAEPDNRNADGNASEMIAEFMLMANRFVGEFLAKNGKAPLMRAHPKPEMADELTKIKKLLCERVPEKYHLFVEYILMRKLTYARYVSSTKEEDCFHYGLDTPWYTHFTSPIRRSSDIYVHFQLAEALYNEPLPALMVGNVDFLVSQCNLRHIRNRDALRICNLMSLHSLALEKKDLSAVGIFLASKAYLIDYHISIHVQMVHLELKNFDVVEFKIVPTSEEGVLTIELQHQKKLGNLYDDYFGEEDQSKLMTDFWNQF